MRRQDMGSACCPDDRAYVRLKPRENVRELFMNI